MHSGYDCDIDSNGFGFKPDAQCGLRCFTAGISRFAAQNAHAETIKHVERTKSLSKGPTVLFL